MNWIRSEVVCQGGTVAAPLEPEAITNADLNDICHRMFVIMETIEFPRCEGRLLPADIFDAIDSLYDNLTFKPETDLQDWVQWIERFGDYYDLDGTRPIEVSPRSCEIWSHINPKG